MSNINWRDFHQDHDGNDIMFEKWVDDCIKNSKKELGLNDTEILFSLFSILFRELCKIKYNYNIDG